MIKKNNFEFKMSTLFQTFTEDYYSAVGSAPILHGDDGLSRRFPDQRLTRLDSGVSLILYDNLVNYRIKTFDKNTSNIPIFISSIQRIVIIINNLINIIN